VVVGEPNMSGAFRVDTDGFVTIPQLGRIQVAKLMQGKAADKIAAVIKNKRLLKVPDVSVVITGRTYATVFVSGAVTTNGRQTIKDETRLAEVLEPAGVLPTSDLSRIVITRAGKPINVDYQKFRTGDPDPSNNPLLRDDDRIFVYTRAPAEGVVRVFGEVVKPDQMTVTTGTTVIQAIQQAGGITAYADRENIVIEREGATIPVAYNDIIPATRARTSRSRTAT
jgi:polysaccharide export outer membrane protein